jgi:hypothetical protein
VETNYAVFVPALQPGIYDWGKLFSRGRYFRLLGSGCNRQSVIPLYCPVCCPANVAEKSWLTTPDRDFTGESFRCPRSHTFSVPVTRASAHARLQRLGTEVGQYHQSARIETLRDATTRNAVSGGCCSGICYDWIRRVLVSSTAKVTYLNLEGTLPATGVLNGDMRKQHRQDERGALMQRQDINPILRQKNDQLYSRYTTDFEAAQQIYVREHNRINQMPGTRQEKQALWDANTRSRDEAQAAATSAYNTGSAAPSMEKAWTDFRKLMDRAIEQQRRALGKTTLRSARPFENLDLVATQDSKDYTGTGLRNLINEVLSNPEFGPDRCAHVGVNPPQGGTGQAVAIHRQNTSGKYHFFDPNFGVYEMNRANLVEAFEFLFATAYPNWAGGGTSDDHPYQVGGRTKGSWSIFKGNRVSAPVVVETPQITVRERVVVPQRLEVVNTMPNIPVTIQTGPVVTRTPTVDPPVNRTVNPRVNPTANPRVNPTVNPATGGQQNPPRRRGNVLDRWTHGS